MRRLTVDNLVDEVRSMLDESNTANLDDVKDILPALNRAQDYASNILARHYDAPLVTSVEVAPVAGQKDYDIPEGAFESRIEKVEVNMNGLFYEVKRISYREGTNYESNVAQNTPYYYAVIGNKFRLYPAPTATYPLRVWYMQDPLPLVKPQGRITSINISSNYVMVDSAGEDLSTLMDELESYVNIVDGESGIVKGSLQIQSINGKRITFKTVPARTTVLGQTILAAIPTSVSPDDLICLAEGNCVPVLKKPFSNFLIQYAVAELTRKLGGAADMELRVKEELEKQVERSWVGREQELRVKKVSKQWDNLTRRVTY